MKKFARFLFIALLGWGLTHTSSWAQTAGSARLEVTLLDYNGSSTKHWAVAWVTTSSGTFIKTLRKQGPSWTSTHWNDHCSFWNTARGGSASGSQALDGYSSATAQDYTGTNSPIILTWNGRDASNNLMADGDYKLWVQYAEDSGQGPYTTSGLLWTKGPTAATNTYANQSANFTSMKVIWTPALPVPPSITSGPPPDTGTVGVPYGHSCTATGTAPIRFSAGNLPTGLAISTNGVISGIPTAAGTFNGSITATNGTVPDASQPFSIVISAVPVNIGGVKMDAGQLVLSGTGPANGLYTVLTSTNVSQAVAQWTPVATNVIGGDGTYSCTNAVAPSPAQIYYRVRVP